MGGVMSNDGPGAPPNWLAYISVPAVHTGLAPVSSLRARIVATGVFAAPTDWGQGEGERSLNGGLSARVERAAVELVRELADRTGAAPAAAARLPKGATRPEDKAFEKRI